MFRLFVCAPLSSGASANLIVPFPTPPASIDALWDGVIGAFALEDPGTDLASDGAEAIHVYDDAEMRWTEVRSTSQLHSYDQLCVTRSGQAAPPTATLPPPRAIAVKENRRSTGPSAVPHTVQPPATLTRSSYPFATGASDSGVVAVTSTEKAQRLFEATDRSRTGLVTQADFATLLRSAGIMFADVAIADVFQRFSGNGQSWSNQEFSNWMSHYPLCADAVLARILERKKEAQLNLEVDQMDVEIRQLDGHRVALERELSQVRASVDQCNDKRSQMTWALNEMLRTRQRVEEQEHVLLDKELRVQFQKALLSKEEAEYRNAARKFEEESPIRKKFSL